MDEKVRLEKLGNEKTAEPPKKPSKLRGVFLIILGLAIIFIALFGIMARNKTATQQIKETITEKTNLPTPTPVPFAEMTIPYLREKKYESKLAELTQVSSNSSYTSYITSYTSDGLKINGLLTVPTGKSPEKGFPAIVFIHGYIPPTIYKTQSNYASFVDYFARNGFVVFKIDLRGHDQSEGEASGAYYSGDYIVDALSAYSALQDYNKVNPKAIGIWGHSMAGNIALRALAVKPDIPAAVIWAGAVYTYSDMQEFGIQDNSYRPPVNDSARQKRRDELFKTHGQFDAKSPFWRSVAATTYLTDLKGAIQLNHAVDDDVVSIDYSRGLNKLLDATTVPHELHEYQSGGHNLTGASFTAAMENSVEFFKKYLK